MVDLDAISTPEQLAELLEGRSDAEVDAHLSEAGTDALLTRVFELMASRFVPERAERTASVEWALDTPDGTRRVTLFFGAGSCRWERDASGMRDTVLAVPVAPFLRLICGRLHPLEAYANQTLRVSGDPVLALTHQTWFDIDLSGAPLDISTPSQLARLIEGQSDAALEAGVMVTGLEAALDRVFAGMVDNYRRGRGPRSRTVIQWHVRTRGEKHVHQLVAERDRCSTRRGNVEPAKVVLSLSLADLLRLAAGKLHPLAALATGQLRVGGNVLVARKIEDWFDRSR